MSEAILRRKRKRQCNCSWSNL